MSTPSRVLVRQRAQQRRLVRLLIKKLLNSVTPPSTGNPDLRQLANTFSRYAQTQQTAYETGIASSSTGTVSVMERTVEHAVAQVLGRTPGSDGGLGAALRGVFPTLAGGRVATDPARTVVSLTGTGPAPGASTAAAGLGGQISAEQATLYRQASIIIPDARAVLAAITPFATVEQPDLVDSLRGLIDDALTTLLGEFGRIDEPRGALVDDYLRSLRGSSGFVKQFGEIAKVDGRTADPDLFSDEQQIAGFKLLETYVAQLNTAWAAYTGRNGNAFSAYPLFTERLARASTMLGVIAQANVNFMAAMDSVGFPETERRSSTSRLQYLEDTMYLTGPQLVGEQTLNGLVNGILRYSTLTVGDYTDWVDKLMRGDGPRVLADSGQLGLEFLTGQADTLFRTIAPVLFFAKASASEDLSGRPIVAQVLAHERVSWAMSDLFSQLDVLADLAA